jgi:hypothetical protein
MAMDVQMIAAGMKPAMNGLRKMVLKAQVIGAVIQTLL